MEALLRFWSERAPREKAILAAGAAVVLAALLYLLLIDPAASGIQRLTRTLPGLRAQAAQLQSLLAEASALKGRPQAASIPAAQLRTTLDQSLAKAGLKATRIHALSDTEYQISFAGVPYAGWTSWLAESERTLGARAVSVNATRANDAGTADIELVLRIVRR